LSIKNGPHGSNDQSEIWRNASLAASVKSLIGDG
jgi:hypothetical protein